MKALHIPHHKGRAAVVIALLASVVCMFAYQLFICHVQSEQCAHGFDVTAPLLLERVIAFLSRSSVIGE